MTDHKNSFIRDYLTRSINVKLHLLDDKKFYDSIVEVALHIGKSVKRGKGKLLICGNGGSAADSQHIAAEFVSRFMFDRPSLPAMALTTDTSALTAIGNDYGFDMLFSRQVESLGHEGDVLIGISTSGNSINVIKAVEVAKEKGVVTVALSGNKGKLKDICDYVLAVPSDSTPHIQESHITIGHMICNLVENELYG